VQTAGGTARRAFTRVVQVTAVCVLAAAFAAGPAFGHGAPAGSPGFSGPVGGPGGKVRLVPTHGQGLGRPAQRSSHRAPRARTAQAAPGSSLILYDSTGAYAWLGQAYATLTANLASHFGAWTAKPVSQYVAGDVERYAATIYIGSTYDEPLPAAFLKDVPASTKPVIWVYDNIWRLTAATPDFQSRYGWMWWQFSSCSTCGASTSPVTEVDYKGRQITRSPLNEGGIMDYSALDAARVKTLATAVRQDGTRFPWAVRSGNLTYVGENPFTYFGESDRMMVFADLLFDALAPQTPERHRALLRLEDITPDNDPAELRAIGDYLAAKKVPFSFGVVPVYTDPNGTYNGGKPLTRRLKDAKDLVSALKYLQSKGGTMIDHGYTHQYGKVANPYNGVSGDDFEFYRVSENADFTLTFHGPVAEDSTKWVTGRLDQAAKGFKDAGLAVPTIFEFPHYSGSALDYRTVAGRFAARYERSLYPLGSMTGATPDYTRVTGQLFPYAVRDVYGQRVLPENLGNVEPDPFHQFPTRSPAQIVADAERNLVVRDGVASFYFHPFFDLSLLEQTVEGIQAKGYTFVAPSAL
jgi:uncharacterized protein YdaL